LDNLKVNCYSGQTYAERPVSLSWQGAEYEIEEIEKAWLEPGKRCFLARTSDNKSFNLWYNEVTDQWQATELGSTSTNAHKEQEKC